MNTLACPTHSRCNSSRGIPFGLTTATRKHMHYQFRDGALSIYQFEYGTNLNIDTVQAKGGTHLIIALNI